jgi:DNA-binding transcriptional MerR regulator
MNAERLDEGFTIRQVAQLIGLSAHTLRYYERIGLLDGVERRANGHRLYTQEDINRLTFLTRLRKTGMSIQEMLRFARLYLEGDSSLGERCIMLEAHRQDVEAQIAALQRNLDAICYKLTLYRDRQAQLTDGVMDDPAC